MTNKPTKENINFVLFLMEVNCVIHVLFCMYCLDHVERQPRLFYIIAAIGMACYLIKGIVNALAAAKLMDAADDEKK